MADDRNAAPCAGLFEIYPGIGTEMIDHAPVKGIGKGERAACMGVIAAPGLTAHTTGREVVYAGADPQVAQVVVRAKGIELVRGYAAEVIDKLLHPVNAAPQLVAQGEHSERGVMSVPTQDIHPLLVQEVHEQGVLVVEIAPERQFRLQHDIERVGSDKGGLGRAPTVEAHVVDAVVGTGTQIVEPRLHIHGYMPCQGPDAGIMLAAQEDAVPVLPKGRAFNAE